MSEGRIDVHVPGRGRHSAPSTGRFSTAAHLTGAEHPVPTGRLCARPVTTTGRVQRVPKLQHQTKRRHLAVRRRGLGRPQAAGRSVLVWPHSCLPRRPSRLPPLPHVSPSRHPAPVPDGLAVLRVGAPCRSPLFLPFSPPSPSPLLPVPQPGAPSAPPRTAPFSVEKESQRPLSHGARNPARGPWTPLCSCPELGPPRGLFRSPGQSDPASTATPLPLHLCLRGKGLEAPSVLESTRSCVRTRLGERAQVKDI